MKTLLFDFLLPLCKVSAFFGSGRYHVLMFHRLCAGESPGSLHLPVETFRSLLRYLLSVGEVVGVDDLFSPKPTSSRCDKFILTFDDGYADNYALLFPVLKEFNVPAIVFVTTSGVNLGYLDFDMVRWALRNSSGGSFIHQESGIKVDEFNPDNYLSVARHVTNSLKRVSHSSRVSFVKEMKSYYSPPPLDRCMLTWDQIGEMNQSGLVSFGSHTVSHPILSNVTHNEAVLEIVSSKEEIVSKVGGDVLFFAYPNGRACDFTSDTIGILQDAGYRGAFTTVPGHVADFIDPFFIPRLDVTPGTLTSATKRFDSRRFSVLTSPLYIKLQRIKSSC